MSETASSNAALTELLGRMTSARQLSAADARILESQGFATVSEEAVLRWLAKEYGVGFTSLDEVEPDKQVLSLFPARLLLKEE
jgi:hypothetical protein